MDLSTLTQMTVLMTFASAVILFVVLRTRKTYPGFGLWTAAMALLLAGTLVNVVVTPLAPLVGIFTGNFLLVSGFVFFYRGLLAFRGRHASYAFELLLALLFFSSFIYWGYFEPNINYRVAAYSVCIGSIALVSLRLLVTQRPAYFGSTDIVLAIWLGLVSVFIWSRAVYAVFFLPQIGQLMTETGFQAAYVAFQIISVLMITLSVVNLNSQRIEYDLRGVQLKLEGDLEERRRIEGALLRSQQQYRLLTENMEDNAWIFDMDEQRFVYVSPSVRTLKGYSPDEVIASGFQSMAMPAQQAQIRQELAQRYNDFLSEKITSQHFFFDEVEQPRKNGTSVWTEISSHFVRSAETGHVELHGITRDLTRRRATDEALRASEEKFRLAFDSANTGMFLCDLHGVILQSNPKAGQILGRSNEEITGTRDAALALAGDAWLTETNRKRMTEGQTDRCAYEQRFMHSEGQVVHCLVSDALVRDVDGKPRYFITQLQDITQRRMAEKALHAALRKSETQESRMHALHEVIKSLMRCDSTDDAFRVLDTDLRKLFFPFDAELLRPDAAGRIPEARTEVRNVSMDLKGEVFGTLRIHASDAALREEDEDLGTFAESAGVSLSLALSNLRLRDEMREQVVRDPLTGLYNRRYLGELMAHEVDRCSRLRQPLSVAMLTLDADHALRHHYTPEAQDAILRHVAALITQWARASDKACRYDLSEFALVMPGAGAVDVTARLEDLRRKVSETSIPFGDTTLEPIGASIGIAQALSRGDTTDMLLARAHAAMLTALDQGGSRVQVDGG